MSEPVGGVVADGIEQQADTADEQSPETYVGYGRAERFAGGTRLARDVTTTYVLPSTLSTNDWGLGGVWKAGAENSVVEKPHASLAFRFHSRDLNFVLGPAPSGEPVRFRVTLDGEPPGPNHGVDSAPDGTGVVREPRLYQLIRQQGAIEDRTFTIEFLDPGLRAYSFTFG